MDSRLPTTRNVLAGSKTCVGTAVRATKARALEHKPYDEHEGAPLPIWTAGVHSIRVTRAAIAQPRMTKDGSVAAEPLKPGVTRSCRSWSGGPVNAFTLWKPDAVKITAGAEHVGMFQKTPVSQRQYCKKCGGHLMTNHPPLGLVDVFSATLPTLKYTPGVHVNYAETVLPMKDGLPKFKDFPAEFGGSGEQIPE
jgi:hypothetical protein